MNQRPPKLAATYSIVARDAATGELGVGVQSNYFSVGTEVSWAEPGVGAIATQSIVEVSYGPRGLERLSQGSSAEEVLGELVAADPGAALRQVAMVDAQGRIAVHTGAICVPACGHRAGDGYCVQGNMLRSDAVWEAMGPAFEAAEGPLAERLLVALEAAEAAGGDVRGRESAALLVVSGERQEHSWEGRPIDIHVEADPNPLPQLRRLLSIRRAYDLFEAARDEVAKGELDSAIEHARRALELQPHNPQFQFWTGIALANAGRDAEARNWLEAAFAAGEGWRELARRLRLVGFFSGDPDLIEP